jgi:predicted AAA+ superfamily ATPase
MIYNRYLTNPILEDLKEKMVFVGGARQVGKTTFATDIIGRSFQKSAYYNWDNRADRRRIMNSDWPGDADLIILDEIHKYMKWKSLIKGEYDKLKSKFRFLVTGSSRLDVFRRGGDSLQGRYHYYRLHPFSLGEVLQRHNSFRIFEPLDIGQTPVPTEFDALFQFGGFPEPLFKASPRFSRRWHNEKLERLFREDISDIEHIRDLGSMKLLSDLLPDRVGSLLSINSLREDLDVSHRAVSHWLDVLDTFYYQFRIPPYQKTALRTIKKEPKLYLWDWSEVSDPAARFENMVAVHLQKFCHFLYDFEGYKTDLYFLRNVDKKEVDFLVAVDQKPWFAVETKLAGKSLSKNLHYFKERLGIPFVYQVVKESGINRLIHGTPIISADCFLGGLV